ncbi:MAG: hypothetical protein Q4B42_08130 [Oscillospiraceae bacterium]|nr:hypothetical protein [Oscillospiraceae bacterium]
MNPFELKAKPLDKCLVSLKALASKPYNKNTADPYTKIRIILMNGTEYESVWMGHQFSRHCMNNELRREIALIRRIEQQQQKRIASLKPKNESILEHTIGYEMLAVDLTVSLAKRVRDETVKKALDFALLEDFDHLYRYSDLLEGERGIKAEKLIGKYDEIMPGRPTIAEHRYPFDDIKPFIKPDADLFTKLCTNIITAAEQQTMNYYMNLGAFYDSDAGRKLYSEIAMIEEQHVSQYGSLKDPSLSWLECCVMHEYTECYLYWSSYETESDEEVKALWEELFEQEVAHLHKACELLEKYEKKSAAELIPGGAFPKALKLEADKEYVRKVLESVRLTADRDDYVSADKLTEDSDFAKYQRVVTDDKANVPSHRVIKAYIAKNGRDYRYEDEPHPVEELRDRSKDNTSIGRVQAD